MEKSYVTPRNLFKFCVRYSDVSGADSAGGIIYNVVGFFEELD